MYRFLALQNHLVALFFHCLPPFVTPVASVFFASFLFFSMVFLEVAEQAVLCTENALNSDLKAKVL